LKNYTDVTKFRDEKIKPPIESLLEIVPLQGDLSLRSGWRAGELHPVVSE